MEKKNLDWANIGFEYVQTDKSYVANYKDGKMENGRDIMEKQRFESPMAPWGGMEQISWSPESDKIAYTCKKLVGLEYSVSTNSEIYVYDLKTGSETNISKGIAGYDQDPVFSPDGKKIVWRSMARDGFEADPTPGVTAERPAQNAHIQNILHTGRVQNGHHCRNKFMLGLMRQSRATTSMVIAR